MVSTITGLAVQRNKAIVGRNAFAHESGIHQDGMLKERSTYEIMRPEDVGVPQTDLVLGKHSGRHALRDRVTEMGFTLTEEQFETLFNDFKALADKKKEVYDEDLVVLIEKHFEDVPAPWQLISLHTTAGTSVLPTATVAIRRPDGEIVQDAAIGDGPVDAIFKAVERVTGVHANLHEFVVRSVTQGKDAQGEVTLELEVESDDRSFRGRAASTDIIEASAHGLHQRRQRHPDPQGTRPRPRGRRPAGGGGIGVRTIGRPNKLLTARVEYDRVWSLLGWRCEGSFVASLPWRSLGFAGDLGAVPDGDDPDGPMSNPIEETVGCDENLAERQVREFLHGRTRLRKPSKAVERLPRPLPELPRRDGTLPPNRSNRGQELGASRGSEPDVHAQASASNSISLGQNALEGVPYAAGDLLLASSEQEQELALRFGLLKSLNTQQHGRRPASLSDEDGLLRGTRFLEHSCGILPQVRHRYDRRNLGHETAPPIVRLTVPQEVRRYKGRSRSSSARIHLAPICDPRSRTPERRRDLQDLCCTEVHHQHLVRMFMPVDNPVFRQVDRRMRRQVPGGGMFGPRVRQVAPLGHRVGGGFETLADLLAQGAIRLLDPVTGAATEGLDRSDQGHFSSLSGRVVSIVAVVQEANPARFSSVQAAGKTAREAGLAPPAGGPTDSLPARTPSRNRSASSAAWLAPSLQPRTRELS